jgi:HAE1 family hydrophobic/amphiphilic exporter-1
LKVDPSQITQIMAMYKAVIPAGQISTGGQDQLVQVGKTLTSPEDVLALQLQGSDGPVTLRDVADVALVPKTVTSISRVNGKPSLSLAVIKTPEANTVAVAAAVREALPGIAEEIGDNVQFETVFDQAPYIEQSIHDLATEGGLGLVMAVLVVLLFLWSVRPTVITAVSIPLSLLIAMIALWLADYTLNLLTLSALTVAVGRVVDDSIVVIENIKRHQSLGEEFGAGLILRAVKEVAGAVTASTITTVAVFAPISLVSGQTGELFRPFGLTITVALLASLLVSLTIVPVLSSWFMRPSRRPVDPGKLARRQSREQQLLAAEHAREERARAREEERLRLREEKLVNKLTLRAGADEATVAAALANLRARHQTGAPASTVNHEAHEFAQTRLQRGYLPVLRWALRHPVVSLVLAAVIFVGTMAMTPLLKTDFIGDAGQTSLTINQSMPAGTTLAQTDEAAKKVEAVLAAQPSMLSYQTTVGGDVLEAAFTGASAGSNKATINVTLKPGSQGVQVADDLRAAFAKMKDVGEVEVMTADGGTGSTAITVQVQGPDPTALAAGADQVQTMLAGVDGVSQVTSDLGEQQTVLQVSLNEPVAAANGMSQVSVGMAANEALQGSPLGEIVVGGIRRDVVLRSRPAITTVEELQSLPLPVTQKQTMDAQKAASDELKADAERQQEQAVAEARRALDQSEAEARSGRAKLADQLSQLRSQLQSLQSAPGWKPSSPPWTSRSAPCKTSARRPPTSSTSPTR